MKRAMRASIQFLVLALLTPSATFAQDAQARFDAADAALNRAYRTITQSKEREMTSSLRESQRIWIEFRDANTALAARVITGTPNAAIGQKASDTEHRVAFLESYFIQGNKLGGDPNNNAFAVIDRLLNEEYKTVRSVLPKAGEASLLGAQRAWVATRDSDLGVLKSVGAIRATNAEWSFLRTRTEQRLAFLRELRAGLGSPRPELSQSASAAMPPESDTAIRTRTMEALESRPEGKTGPLSAIGHAEPILRIDAGMHTSPVNKLSTDAAGHLALTVSDDKTARLWEIPSGRLLRTLRPPIGDGDNGKISGCALNPDGSLAAVGGSSGAGVNENHIDLFDPASGRLLRRLDGLPFILDIAFSHDGHFLAAALGLKGGLRVFDSSTGREIGRDENYPYSCMSVDWAQDGRLLTVSGGPTLRIYNEGKTPSLQPAAGRRSGMRWKPAIEADAGQDGLVAFRARFSPDGRRIAVGFDDYTDVSVYDGLDLSYLFSPDSKGLPGGKGWGGLHSLTWSADGSTLSAGGGWQDGNHSNPIRRWNQVGKGRAQDFPASSKSITDMRSLPDGSVLFGAEDPVLSLLSRDGKLSAIGRRPIADFRASGQDNTGAGQDTPEAFRLSGDALDVGFGFEYGGKPRARFSLARRTLDLLEKEDWPTDLRLPKITGIAVKSWKDSHFADVDGGNLDLSKEYSHCLAIAPDSSYFVLGTGSALHCFDPKGRQRWKQLSFGETWAVNLSADGKLAVAAFGDGTIRWYRARDGRELLALFPHADKKRWVVWTPEGYYDASAGAEDIIGWHVNRGKDQAADFFSAARFRNIYFRPDVLQGVLKTLDVAEALKQANHERGLPETKPDEIGEVIARLAPPVVELETGGVSGTVALPNDAKELKIRYRVRQTGAEAPSKVAVRFNGRLVDMAVPLPEAGQPAEVTVPVPAGMTGEFSVIAEHRLATSEVAILRVERALGGIQPRQPNLYVLAVGVADLKVNDAADLDRNGLTTMDELERSGLYKEGDLALADLKHAASDAQRVVDAFRSQEGKLYGRVTIQTLLDKNATTQALREALREIAQKAQPEDVTVVFFSGHGVVDPKLGFYLATYDADPQAPAKTALLGNELSTLLEGIKSRTVLALDTCHSGGALEGTRQQRVVTSPNDLTGLINELSSAEQGVVVLSSSQATEESLEDSEKGGVFTQAFREGLSSKIAAVGAEAVTCRTMQDWLNKRVPEIITRLTKGAPNVPQQTPACVIPKGVPDFPISKP